MTETSSAPQPHTGAGQKALRIDTDRPEIREGLERLAALVTEAGGRFSPGLFVRAREGELTLASDGPNDRTVRLLQVPYAAMPNNKSFTVALDDGRFAYTRSEDGPPASDLEEQAFAAMLDVYNLMDKPRQWAEQCPWLTLWHDLELFEHLVEAGGGRPGQRKLQLYREGRWNDILIGTFLHSRVFNLKADPEAAKADGEPDAPATTGKAAAQVDATSQVLMPFIDYLNHHLSTRGFMHDREAAGGSLYTFQDRVADGSNECFVRYNLLDLYGAYLAYGFLDESAPFTVSQPATLTPTGGPTLYVGRNIARGFKGKYPKALKDLGVFLPQFQSRRDGGLSVSRLLIPGANAPYALRRVLRAALSRKCPQWTDRQVESAVLEAEAQLLDQNHRFYDAIAEKVANARGRSARDDPQGRLATLRALDQVVIRNKRHLYDYRDRLAAA